MSNLYVKNTYIFNTANANGANIMPKLTKAQNAKLAKIEAHLEACRMRVYAEGAPGFDNVQFACCLSACPAETQNAWEDAHAARDAFHRQMVDEGRGWFDFGVFRPYP